VELDHILLAVSDLDEAADHSARDGDRARRRAADAA
jgi:hypothetical protein